MESLMSNQKNTRKLKNRKNSKAERRKNKIFELIHDFFELGIAIKGVHGVINILLGLFFLFASPNTIGRFIQRIFSKELAHDPTDLLANLIIHSSQGLIGAQHYTAVYLIIHGLVDVGLFFALYYEKLWAFPMACTVLGIFALYQLYRFVFHHSIVVFILLLIDLFIITVIMLEYYRLRSVKK
jgi:uncharacterized membrane protein